MTDTRNLYTIYRAGSVTRWHTDHKLARTMDRNDAHSARVARIILALHPNPSADLLAAALQHDDGEHGAGADMRGDAKRAMRLDDRLVWDKREYKAARAVWGDRLRHLQGTDAAWLALADALDAYCWMLVWEPQYQYHPDWQDAMEVVEDMASALGVHDPAMEYIEDVQGDRK